MDSLHSKKHEMVTQLVTRLERIGRDRLIVSGRYEKQSFEQEVTASWFED